MELEADTAVAGLLTAEDKHDPISVKSRTGVLLHFDRIPIYWISMLWSEISLPTLEAKYIAMYQDMRELVLDQSLILEVRTRMNLKLKGASAISNSYADNIGNQHLASSKGHAMTAHTKHIGIT